MHHFDVMTPFSRGSDRIPCFSSMLSRGAVHSTASSTPFYRSRTNLCKHACKRTQAKQSSTRQWGQKYLLVVKRWQG